MPPLVSRSSSTACVSADFSRAAVIKSPDDARCTTPSAIVPGSASTQSTPSSCLGSALLATESSCTLSGVGRRNHVDTSPWLLCRRPADRESDSASAGSDAATSHVPVRAQARGSTDSPLRESSANTAGQADGGHPKCPARAPAPDTRAGRSAACYASALPPTVQMKISSSDGSTSSKR